MLDHLDELVVKAVNESGGYGMLIGPPRPRSSATEFRRAIVADPRNYIAQPTIALSRHPTFVDGRARAGATSTCGRSSSPAPTTSRSCPAASRASRCGAARSSSTRRRAAAARTPGCCTDGVLDAEPRGRVALLDRRATSSAPRTSTRLLDVNFHALLDAQVEDRGQTWLQIVQLLGDEERYREHYDEATARST